MKLNTKENKVWVKLFNYYKDKGYSDLKADKFAFEDLVKEYPRLKGSDRIK